MSLTHYHFTTRRTPIQPEANELQKQTSFRVQAIDDRFPDEKITIEYDSDDWTLAYTTFSIARNREYTNFESSQNNPFIDIEEQRGDYDLIYPSLVYSDCDLEDELEEEPDDDDVLHYGDVYYRFHDDYSDMFTDVNDTDLYDNINW